MTESLSFNSLPDEIIAQCLVKLNSSELKGCLTACKRLSAITLDGLLYREIIIRRVSQPTLLLIKLLDKPELQLQIKSLVFRAVKWSTQGNSVTFHLASILHLLKLCRNIQTLVDVPISYWLTERYFENIKALEHLRSLSVCNPAPNSTSLPYHRTGLANIQAMLGQQIKALALEHVRLDLTMLYNCEQLASLELYRCELGVNEFNTLVAPIGSTLRHLLLRNCSGLIADDFVACALFFPNLKSLVLKTMFLDVLNNLFYPQDWLSQLPYLEYAEFDGNLLYGLHLQHLAPSVKEVVIHTSAKNVSATWLGLNMHELGQARAGLVIDYRQHIDPIERDMLLQLADRYGIVLKCR